MAPILASSLSMLMLAASVAASGTSDPVNPLKYNPSNALTTVALALVLSVALLQTWCMKRWAAVWMLPMTIGAYTLAAGFAIRYLIPKRPDSIGIFIAENSFIVLSPCAFIAAEYVLLGRLARHLRADRHLLIRPQKLTVVFVSSDILTFLIQGAGGGLAASRNANSLKLGARLFLVGLAAQLASFFLFVCLFLVFLYRVSKHERQVWTTAATSWFDSWKTLAFIMCISCTGILVRSCFRVAEQSSSTFNSPLSRSEPLFYGLDILPLFIAISIYVPFWPGRYIDNRRAGEAGSGVNLTEYQVASKRGESTSYLAR